MAKTVGFIGSGNMGRAIMGGMIAAGLYAPSQILASAKTTETVEKIEKELGIVATTDNTEVARKADILFLAVKPGVFATVIPQIRDVCKEGQVVVSIAAGHWRPLQICLDGRSNWCVLCQTHRHWWARQ